MAAWPGNEAVEHAAMQCSHLTLCKITDASSCNPPSCCAWLACVLPQKSWVLLLAGSTYFGRLHPGREQVPLSDSAMFGTDAGSETTLLTRDS